MSTTHHLLPLPPCLSQKQRNNLWAKVKKGSKHDCWPWQGRVGGSGYPLVWINNVQFTATRIAYLDHYGKQPGDLLVCHTCDNRADHLSNLDGLVRFVGRIVNVNSTFDNVHPI